MHPEFASPRNLPDVIQEIEGVRIDEVQAQIVVRYLSAIETILPHVSIVELRIALPGQTFGWARGHVAEQFTLPSVGAVGIRIARREMERFKNLATSAIDANEKALFRSLVRRLSHLLGNSRSESDWTSDHRLSLDSVLGDVEEAAIGDVLRGQLVSRPDFFAALLRELHKLGGLTYENQPIPFGCIVVPAKEPLVDEAFFPHPMLEWKSFRALSDGYRSAYVVDGFGRLRGFVSLEDQRGNTTAPRSYVPRWSETIALEAQRNWAGIGVCLSASGDILIFERGTLRFSYRSGRWQYWGHNHIVAILRDLLRGQNVPAKVRSGLANVLYRVALDLSFRRHGALFVVLDNQRRADELLHERDRVGHPRRSNEAVPLDQALGKANVLSLPRAVIGDLASIDGAVVLSKKGQIESYGAVLKDLDVDPDDEREEGARTKAARQASSLGTSIKISADGPISVYRHGKKIIEI